MRSVCLFLASASLLLCCNPSDVQSHGIGPLADNFSVPDYAQVILGDKPLAFYRLNESSGTVAHDSSANALNGTYGAEVALKAAGLLTDSPDTAAGFKGGDDSTANYIRVPKTSDLQPTAAISVEAWVKPTSAGSSVALLSYGTDSISPWQPYILRLDGTQITFQAVLNDTVTSLTSTASLTLGQTYYVVGTYNGSSLAIYINGALDSTLAATGSISNYTADTTSGLGIGHRYNDTATQDVLAGTLGQVAVYGSALSAARVLAHYKVGKGLPLYSEVVLSDNPAAYFRLDETSGTTAADSSPNALKGTYGADVKLGATGLVIDDPDDAAGFNGGSAETANYIQVPKTTVLQPTTALSVECWVSPTADGDSVALLSYGTDGAAPWQPYILMLSGTQITFQMVLGSKMSTLNSKASLTLGKTYHVVGTYNGTTQALYIDGALDSDMAASGAISNYTGDATSGLGIGHRYNAYSSQPVLDGTLAQVAIYPSALSAARILAHYQTGTGVVQGTTSTTTTTSSTTSSTTTASSTTSGTTGGHGTTGGTTSSSSTSGSTTGEEYDVFPNGHGVFPAGGKSPFYPSSVYHLQLPASPVTVPDSVSQKWNQYNEDGDGTWGTFGGATNPQYDEGWPVYFVNGRPGIIDASYYDVNCDGSSWGVWECTNSGFTSGSAAPFAAGYTVEENTDHHVSTIDMKTRKEYGFWTLNTLAGPNQTGVAGSGGVCDIDGDGVACSGDDATNMANSLGLIYYQDLLYCETSGDNYCTLPTALALAPKCNSSAANAGFANNYVYPANTSDGQCFNAPAGSRSDSIIEGVRGFIDLTDDQINALPLKPFEKIIYRTIDKQHFGVIVRDTGWSGGAAFQVMAANNSPWALYGNPSPMVALAKLEGINPDSHGLYTFQITDTSGTDVVNNLKWCAPNSAGQSSGKCDGK